MSPRLGSRMPLIRGKTDVDAQVVGERDGRHNGRIAIIIRGSGGGARADGPSLRPTGVPVI